MNIGEIPALIAWASEYCLLITTFRDLLVKKDFITEKTFPVIPELESLFNNPLYYILSNAFDISNMNILEMYLLSSGSLIL